MKYCALELSVKMRKNSAAEHNSGSLLINRLRGLFYLRKPFCGQAAVAVLFLKFRAHIGRLLLWIGAGGKWIANVTRKSSVNSNWKLKGDFVSFLYGKCVPVISAWQCRSECVLWTITNNDSRQPRQKTWHQELTMTGGSRLLTDLSRSAFLLESRN